MVAHHRLVEIAHHVDDTKRTHALRPRVGGLTKVAKDLPGRRLLNQALAILVADRLAREAVGIRPHFLTFAGEVPLTLRA